MKDIPSAMKETLLACSIKGSVVVHEDLGWFGLGGRVARQSEIYHVSVGKIHYAWKRWAPNITESNIRLQLEAITYLADSGIPVPRSVAHCGDNLLFLSNGSRCSLFEYRRGNYYTGTLQEQLSAFAIQFRLIAALRKASFKHADGAQAIVTTTAVLNELEYIRTAVYNPETGTHPDEVSRIREQEIPRLVTLVQTLSHKIEDGEISWVHADFHQRNLSFNPDGTVCAVYDFDFLHRDYVAADIAHTLEMFTVHSAEPGYHTFAAPNYYRTMSFVLDIERMRVLIKNIRETGALPSREISSLRNHLTMLGIWKLSFLYRQGIEGPLGRKLLAREFMFQRKLDWTLAKNPELEIIFGKES